MNAALTSPATQPVPARAFPRRGKIPSLDGWRAIAILLVLIGHWGFASGYPNAGLWKWTEVFQGVIGVRIFFVISGLLITFLLLREAHETGGLSLRSFYARRALRILPVYYVYLAVLALCAALHWYSDGVSSWIGALTFTRDFGGRGVSATIHFWSLAIEEQFYLAWPLCFAALALWKKPRVYAGLLLAVVVICPFLRAHIATDLGGSWRDHLLSPLAVWMHADSLAIGCLGAWPAWHWRDRRWHPAALGAVALAATLAIVGTRWLEWWPEGALPLAHSLIPSVQNVAILALIWVTVRPESGWLFRVLNAPGLVWIGVLSYSLYVWHLLFLGYFVGAPMATWWTHDYRWWFVGAFAAAAASYYGLERPILKLKARLHPPGRSTPAVTAQPGG